MISKFNSYSRIIINFHKNVLGKSPSKSELESKHKGKRGHWLETKLGGKIDADGNADLNGYECKVKSQKTTWGDWGAPYRIFSDKRYTVFNKKHSHENMHFFVKTFGLQRNEVDKGIYYSMSGKDFPQKINDSTDTGLSLIEKNSDILMQYSFSKDKRKNKKKLVPNALQKNNLLIYQWHGTDNNYNVYVNNIKINNLPIDIKKTSFSLEERVRRKFGIYGVVVGLYDKSKGFYGLEFLKVVTFNDWLDAFKNKDIIFDSGLTTLSKRQRNQWRSSAKFMGSLVVNTYIPKIP